MIEDLPKAFWDELANMDWGQEEKKPYQSPAATSWELAMAIRYVGGGLSEISQDFWTELERTELERIQKENQQVAQEDESGWVELKLKPECKHRWSNTGIPGGNRWCLECDKDWEESDD